jgi:hypothetical protein
MITIGICAVVVGTIVAIATNWNAPRQSESEARRHRNTLAGILWATGVGLLVLGYM